LTITLRPHQKEAVNAMWDNNKGQVIIPTGGGKTICMIEDAITNMEMSKQGQTFVVVAPRILLAEQLCSEFLELIDTSHTHIMHVHSGETHHFSSTNPSKIHLFANTARTAGENVIIFTTYHSLHRLIDADIEVNTIYFDEAHNSVQRNFFPATEHFAADSNRCYFFTATRRTSATIFKPGMNDTEVYGDVIYRVPATKLVDGGYILPPQIKAKKFEVLKANEISADRDCNNIVETLEENNTSKVLVCVKSAKQLINLMSQTDFAMRLNDMGYSFLYITSKTGAIIDGQKVNREVFFNTLNAWGKDPSKKFVCLHRSILSEGISVNGLESVIFLRNMDVIEMTQTIGRVLRTAPNKTYGLCVVPVYSQVGIATEKRMQNVVDTIFGKGEMLDSVVKR
jgi:superfamily II DNA or RNA helicase